MKKEIEELQEAINYDAQTKIVRSLAVGLAVERMRPVVAATLPGAYWRIWGDNLGFGGSVEAHEGDFLIDCCGNITEVEERMIAWLHAHKPKQKTFWQKLVASLRARITHD